MTVRMCAIVSCLILLPGLVLVGCAKKTDQRPPAAKTGAGPVPSVPQTSADQSPSAPQASPEVSAAVAADLEKPVPEVQTKAQTMSVADLKATALQYVQAISVKKEDLQKVLAQVKEIPLAEALSEKAKTLKAEVQKIQTSLKDLTDRFQVYYNKLKEKGGDLSGLTI
ncbi:MAG: hypothetical protein M1376_06220 [Planctomycetes bacterium]|nr:hypothetical protein [Planctomycetota bacterium]